VYPVLEAGRFLHQVRPLAYQLAEVADVLARYVRARHEVRSQQMRQGPSVDLVRLHLRLGDRSDFQGMSQHDLEPSSLDRLVDELPDARRFQDEAGVLEPIQESIQIFHRGKYPLVREDLSARIHHACLTKFFMHVQSYVCTVFRRHR